MTLSLWMVGLLAAGPAHAYELHTTEDGDVVRWQRSHIVLEISHEARELTGAAEMAAETWRGLPGSPDIEIVGGRDLGPPGYDGRNGVYVANAPDRRAGHLAVTVLTTTRNGEIVDADVLIDPEMLAELALLDQDRPSSDRFDSASLLAHELGHVLGLDDTSEPHREATMWGRLKRGHIHNRTLEPDDEAGITAAYSLATAHEEIVASSNTTALACNVTHTARRPGWALLPTAGIALAALTIRRRLRPRRE